MGGLFDAVKKGFCSQCNGRGRTTSRAVPCTRCNGPGREPGYERISQTGEPLGNISADERLLAELRRS